MPRGHEHLRTLAHALVPWDAFAPLGCGGPQGTADPERGTVIIGGSSGSAKGFEVFHQAPQPVLFRAYFD